MEVQGEEEVLKCDGKIFNYKDRRGIELTKTILFMVK